MLRTALSSSASEKGVHSAAAILSDSTALRAIDAAAAGRATGLPLLLLLPTNIQTLGKEPRRAKRRGRPRWCGDMSGFE